MEIYPLDIAIHLVNIVIFYLIVKLLVYKPVRKFMDERTARIQGEKDEAKRLMPAAVGYQPTLAEELGELEERITSTSKGSITSVQAIYVPADDLTAPAPATIFSHLDATTVLSRQISEQGIYPAVSPLESSSRILDPAIVGQEHYDVARKVQECLQRYNELKDIIAILGMFEPFTQDLENEARRRLERGSGLGLSIVRRLTQLMGGEISVHSELGRGTSVLLQFTFPGAPVDTAAPYEPDGANQTIQPLTGTVLLAEDNAINMALARARYFSPV